MNHETYVAERSLREPRFADERKAAVAELTLGELLVRRRMEQNVSLAQLAETTGIPEARLEEIEAGESLTLHEVLWPVHALDADVSVRAGFTVTADVAIGEDRTTEVTTYASRPERPPKAATA